MRHWRFVSSLQFSPDGKFLYSAGAGVIKKWNLAVRSLVDSIQIGHSESQSLLNTEGDRLAINADVVIILDADNLSEETLTIDIQNGSYSVQFSDDGSLIAIGASDGRVCVYNADAGDIKWEQRAHNGSMS
jgi:WD40 repeat protein